MERLFKAFDGKIFTDEKECMIYEQEKTIEESGVKCVCTPTYRLTFDINIIPEVKFDCKDFNKCEEIILNGEKFYSNIFKSEFQKILSNIKAITELNDFNVTFDDTKEIDLFLKNDREEILPVCAVKEYLLSR